MDNLDAEDTSGEEAQAGIEHQQEEVHERPEWLPENFFDPKKGPKYEDLAKSYAELRTKFSQGKHKAPEGGNYDIALFKDKGIKEDDGVLGAYKGWAAKHGISQDAFSDLAGTILGMAGDNAQQAVRSIEDERKALGPNADAVVRGMADWARGLVRKGVWGKDDFEEFKVFAGTANGLKAAMKLREAYEGRIPDMTVAATEGEVTEAELQNMVGDPRYEKDAAYRAKVEKAFERFYGGKAA
jgi:hypothetical protein